MKHENKTQEMVREYSDEIARKLDAIFTKNFNNFKVCGRVHTEKFKRDGEEIMMNIRQVREGIYEIMLVAENLSKDNHVIVGTDIAGIKEDDIESGLRDERSNGFKRLVRWFGEQEEWEVPHCNPINMMKLSEMLKECVDFPEIGEFRYNQETKYMQYTGDGMYREPYEGGIETNISGLAWFLAGKSEHELETKSKKVIDKVAREFLGLSAAASRSFFNPLALDKSYSKDTMIYLIKRFVENGWLPHEQIPGSLSGRAA